MHIFKTRPIPNNFFMAAMLLFALCIAVVAGAQPAGKLVPLNPPQPVENDGKIEILEFFSYGCGHCAHLEPLFEQWAKKQPVDVKIKRVPAGHGFESRGIDSVPIFYTLEAMGLLEKLHQKLFDAANIENVILGNPATLNKWLEKQGVDAKAYENMQKSFSIQNKIARAYKMTVDYKITGTPTLIVNGRIAVTVQGSEEGTLATIDQLIHDARASNRTVAAATTASTTATAARPKKAVVKQAADQTK